MNPSKKHIVLLEDDPDDTEFFRTALQDTHPGCQLTTVVDGRHLKGVLREIEHPDVIVMDYNLPGKPGTEYLKEIRSDKSFDRVPVVMFSSHKNPVHIDACLSNGAVHYYLKPQTFTEIKEVVNRICNDSAGFPTLSSL
ncbi:MAG: response regulator [Bacteroidota bacterium]